MVVRGGLVVAGALWGLPAMGAEAYEVLTYNVQFRPPIATEIFDSDDSGGADGHIYGVDDDTRAFLIAEEILDLDPEIVVLQEVWTDRAYEAFVKHLGDAYPQFTERHDGGNGDLHPPGMVLFVKEELDLVPQPKPEGIRRSCLLDGAVDTCLVPFLEFEKQEGVEELVTQKGIGFAHVRGLASDRDLRLFFTHLQSGTKTGDVDDRASQVKEAVEFIATSSVGGNAADLLLAGDLNVKAPLLPGDDATATGEPSLDYGTVIADGGFADLPLADLWLTQSPLDEGNTFDPVDSTASFASDRSRQRIDYFLHRSPLVLDKGDVLPCATHVEIERFRGPVDVDGGLRDLSDHFGLRLVVGTDARRCSPSLADTVDLDPGDDAELVGALPTAGNFEWFFLPQAGTYDLVAFAGDDPSDAMEVVAYDPSDLSTPLDPSEIRESDLAPRAAEAVVHAPTGLYVRVGRTDGATGPFTFLAHSHGGASFDDALILLPGEIGVPGPVPVAHFELQQLGTASGASQDLGFLAQCVACTVRLFDAEEQPIPTPGSQAGLLTVDGDLGLVSGDAQKLYFTVSVPAEAQWSTNRRQLNVHELRVMKQDDVFGVDEVSVDLSVDGLPFVNVLDEADLDRNELTRLKDDAYGFLDTLVFRTTEHGVLVDNEMELGKVFAEDLPDMDLPGQVEPVDLVLTMDDVTSEYRLTGSLRY